MALLKKHFSLSLFPDHAHGSLSPRFLRSHATWQPFRNLRAAPRFALPAAVILCCCRTETAVLSALLPYTCHVATLPYRAAAVAETNHAYMCLMYMLYILYKMYNMYILYFHGEEVCSASSCSASTYVLSQHACSSYVLSQPACSSSCMPQVYVSPSLASTTCRHTHTHTHTHACALTSAQLHSLVTGSINRHIFILVGRSLIHNTW